MQQLIIGDIHGCFEEFNNLLDASGISDKAQIIALGDIVDRGPDSVKLLQFFRESPNAISLMGNHERKHVRSRQGLVRPAFSQRIVRHQIGSADYEAACQFMDRMPRSLECPDAVLTHGFFEPGRALEDQKETMLVGVLSAEYRLRKHYDKAVV